LKEKSISAEVFRYDPAKAREGYYKKYEVPYFDHMDVIDVLKYIQVNMDQTFAFRYSCEEGKCGLCGLLVNDKPVLACKHVVQKEGELKIDPLPNFPIIRDLVVDRDTYNDELVDLQVAFANRNASTGPVPSEYEAEYVEHANCVECGACVVLCPAATAGVHPSVGPVGFLQSVRNAIFVPSPVITPQGGVDLFDCLECGQCYEICPRDVNVPELVRKARGSTKDEDVWPEGAQQVRSVLRESKVLLTRDSQHQPSTAAWLRRARPNMTHQVGKTAKVGVFVGCQFGMRSSLQNTAVHLTELLLHARIEFTLLGESEWCCGHPSYIAGDVEAAGELALHNLAEFAKLGVGTLVTACPGCYRAWKYEYPEVLGEETGFRVVHSSEFLLSLLQGGAFDIGIGGKCKRITYHDPCELGRLSGIYDPPRELMCAIPGIEVTDSRELSKCCGGGGLVPAANPELSTVVAEQRVKELVDSGASVVATACPSCELILGIALRKLGERQFKVFDIIDVLYNAVFDRKSP
jgi:succinate dehydrogenase/fumarate reductase iron-sulfur protein